MIRVWNSTRHAQAQGLARRIQCAAELRTRHRAHVSPFYLLAFPFLENWVVLEASWGILVASWGLLGASWGVLGVACGFLGES